MPETHAFRHEPRKDLTDQERAKLFLDRGGACEGPCGRKLRNEPWHLDHIRAIELGGTNDPSNLQILCEWCHKPKTAEDHSKAAKGKRLATAQAIPPSQRQKKGRPMPGSKRSGWKKTFNRGWVRR